MNRLLGKPAGTGKTASTVPFSHRQTHNSTSSSTKKTPTPHPAQFKKMTPTLHPFNDAKRMIHLNNNTTAQVVNH